jgi:hypothetical protein
LFFFSSHSTAVALSMSIPRLRLETLLLGAGGIEARNGSGTIIGSQKKGLHVRRVGGIDARRGCG